MERALIEYILNSLWQAPLLAVGGWLLVRIVEPKPAVQHRVWLAILLAMVALPLGGVDPRDSSILVAHPGTVSAHISTSAMAPNAIERSMQLLARLRNIELTTTTAQWLVWMFGIMVAFGVLRLARKWGTAQRLVKDSREVELTPHASNTFEKFAQRLGVELPVLRESDGVASPAIVGAWRPVLLLPENFFQHTEDEIEAAFCHELAHVRRRDYLVNVACEILALPLFWHPATHTVLRRIRVTREMACDAIAAEEMRSEIGYAKCLVTLAESMLGSQGEIGQALGLFHNNRMEERVMWLMRTKTAENIRTRVAHVTIGIAAMAIAVTAAGMFHVTPILAQAGSETPATTPAAPKGLFGINGLTAAGRGKNAHIYKQKGEKGKGEYLHRWQGADGEPYTIVNHQRQEPTAQEKRRIERRMKQPHPEISAEALGHLPTPAERRRVDKQLANSRAAIEAASKTLNSPEFQRQIQEMAKMKIEMPDVQVQVHDALAQLNDPKFQQQMQEMVKMKIDMKELNLPDVRVQVQKALAQLNSPESQRRMADMQKRLQSGELQRAMEQASRQIEDAQKRMRDLQSK